jgi:hypothetical protein
MTKLMVIWQTRPQITEATVILTSNDISRKGRLLSSFVRSFVRLYIRNEFHALFITTSLLKGLKAEGMCILFVSTFFYYKRIYMVVKSINSKPIPKHVNVYSCE